MIAQYPQLIAFASRLPTAVDTANRIRRLLPLGGALLHAPLKERHA